MASVDVLPPVFPKAVPVVFGADDNFFIPLVVCIQSLVHHTSPENCYDIVVLANKFRPQYVKMLEKIGEGRDNVSIRVYDVAPFLQRWDMSKLKTGHRLSLATYYRLFIPELMREYNKVVYIDGDIVLMEDIANLYNIDISGCYAGAVRDGNVVHDMSESFRTYMTEVLGITDPSQYFNAGVLLLDLTAIRRDFSLDFMMEQAELKGAKHHDQDVLNSLFYGKVRFLHSCWNGGYSEDENGQGAGLIHYAGRNKPWLVPVAFSPVARYYWKHALVCPYADEIIHAFQEDCRRSVRQYPQLLLQYLRCWLGAFALSGRRKRHYSSKLTKLREELSVTRRVMRLKSYDVPWRD